MSLNQLIAQGGTQNKSPVQRYMETRGQMENENKNRLAQQATMQNMQIQKQQQAMQQQKQKAVMGEKYAQAITPMMEVINRLPEGQRQEAWLDMYPEAQKVGYQFGIPPDEKMKMWNQNGADALISQYGKPMKAPTTRTVLEGSEKVNQEWNAANRKWDEVGRGITTELTGKAGNLTKPVTTDIQKQLTKNLLAKDRITTGINFVMKNQNLFDVGSKMSAGIGNAMEMVGIDAPDFLKKEVQGMADLNTYSLNIANGIRKEITGAASSFKELDKFIYPLVSKGTDGKTRAIKRMQSLTMFNEMTTVRLNRLLQDGYSVTSKKGDKTMVIKDKNGKSVAVEKAFPLTSIPTYKKRKGILLEKMAQGKKPSEFNEEQRKQMFGQVQEMMTIEGYNTDVSRLGWEM